MQPVYLLRVLCAVCCHAAAPAVSLPTSMTGMQTLPSFFGNMLIGGRDHDADLKVVEHHDAEHDAVVWKFEHLKVSVLPNQSDLVDGRVSANLEEVEKSSQKQSLLEMIVNLPVALTFLSFVAAGASGKRWLSLSTGKSIKQTGGALGRCINWCHTVLCMYAQLFQFTVTLRWGGQGVILAMLYQFAACVLIDGIISDAPWDNLRSLRRNGFQDWQVVASLVTCQIVWGSNSFWAWYFVPEFHVSCSLSALTSLVLSLACAEIIFTGLHVLMHQRTFFDAWVGDDGWVHKFHHCCLTPSMSSNYVFSVVDGLIESHGPWLAAWSVYKFVIQDPWGLWLSLYVIQQWYLLDHDENIQTHHWRHHKYIDAEYNAYSPTKMKGVKDQLRMKVKRSDE